MNATSKGLVALYLHRRGEHWLVEKVKDKEGDKKTQCLSQGGIYHYVDSNGVYKTSVVFPVSERMVGLSNALRVFEDKKLNIVHIESRHVQGKPGEFEIYLEIDSVQSEDWNELQIVMDTLNGIDLGDEERPVFVRDASFDFTEAGILKFPKCIKELDDCQRILTYGKELDADHPGFKDQQYRKRRQFFGDLAMIYKYGQKIPRVKYSSEEIRTWGTVFRELTILHAAYACKTFLDYFPDLAKHCGYRDDNIPQLEDINIYLRSKTGFQVRPVAGYLSPRDFLAGLAFRVFHCTQYIRHYSDPFYTPEPDVCHELLGHMPLFADAEFAQFSQEIGLASLGAEEEEIQKLVSCYFFTVEFGLCREDGKMKVYGAGLLSSAAELSHVMTGIEHESEDFPVKRFTVEDVCSAEIMVTEYQKQYFYTDSMEEATNFVRDLANSIKRPFGVRYNPYTHTVEMLNNQNAILDVAKELRGDLCIVASALKKMQDQDSLFEPDTITNYLTLGLDLSPYGSRSVSRQSSRSESPQKDSGDSKD